MLTLCQRQCCRLFRYDGALPLPRCNIMPAGRFVQRHSKGNKPMGQISASDPFVVLSYARTPMGGLAGVFADVAATDLGATAVKAAVERAGIAGQDVER